MPPALAPRSHDRLTELVLLAVAVVIGCGRPPVGPPRFAVRGHVTYRGEPLPAGEIVFEPDSAAGNRGPAGYGVIIDGRFETHRDTGTVGGPQTVRISGFDGHAEDEFPQGKHLFIDYTIPADLPRQDAMIDFDVPAKAGAVKSQR
jgi:hypothetical protein